MRRWLIAATAVSVLAAAIIVTRDRPRPSPTPPGAFSFAVLGDAPYHAWEDVKYRLVLRALDAHDLSFVLHIGDIFWKPCSSQVTM